MTNNKAFTKADLRTGDLIVVKDDTVPVDNRIVRVYKGTGKDDIVSGCTWFPLKSYSDELLFEHKDVQYFDVVFLEVWRPKSNKDFKENQPTEDTHKLLWKYEQPKVKSDAQVQLETILDRIAELESQAKMLGEMIAKEVLK